MSDNIKIGIIGGDARSLVCAEYLSKSYECAVWGFDTSRSDLEGHLGGSVKCTDWESAVKCSDAVILPLPVSRDGIHLSCPLASVEATVRLEDIVKSLKASSILMGGKIPPAIKRLSAELGISTYDYYDSEEVQIKNSVPTAEGAISSCITNLPITIHGMRASVIGYGRIGQLLAHLLRAMGARVTVYARREESLSMAEACGCHGVSTNQLLGLAEGYRIIFNTVPVRLMGKELLSVMPCHTLIIDLASAPGGLDPDGAREATARCGLQVVKAPSLPGRYAPRDAGRAIAAVILDQLRNGEPTDEGGKNI